MTRDELFASIVAAGPGRDDLVCLERRGDSYDWRFLTVVETRSAAAAPDVWMWISTAWPLDEPELLRRFLAGGQPVADIVDRWVALLAAGLTADRRDGCPIEPIATESVNASALVREASARAFTGWCTAIEERLRADGWSAAEAKSVAVAVIALIEGALILSRIAGDVAALEAAKPAARRLLRR